MKSRKPLLSTFVASALLFGGAVLAQDVPPPPPPPTPTQQAVPPAPTDQTVPAAPAEPAVPPAPADQAVPPAPAQPAVPADPSDQTAPPASAMPAAPAETAPAATDQTSATEPTAQGQVTVNSSPAPAPTIGEPPSYEQLSGGSKSVSEDQAAAYPPLANDFIHADRNRNGKISKSEYARWVKNLHQ